MDSFSDVQTGTADFFKLRFVEQLALLNAKFKMQNAELWCRRKRLIGIISGGNTFILHSAFSILHFERQLDKLKFPIPFHRVL